MKEASDRRPELRDLPDEIALEQATHVEVGTPFLERVNGKLQKRARALIERRPGLVLVESLEPHTNFDGRRGACVKRDWGPFYAMITKYDNQPNIIFVRRRTGVTVFLLVGSRPRWQRPDGIRWRMKARGKVPWSGRHEYNLR
jgi:hypothetical protein